MMRTSPGAALLLVALPFLAGCLHAIGTPEEPVIRSLDLRGVKAVKGSDLRSRLATQASGRFAWSEVSRLDPDGLATDRERVVAFYKERGYYRASVEEMEVVPDGEGRVRLVLHIREGNPVRVTRVDVMGLAAAPEARARVGALGLAPGQLFTWAAFDAARAELQAALAETGYATGTVTQAALVNGDAETAEVTYQVEAGPRFRFGAISVLGTAAVPPEKVVAQAERLVKPGEWYDERLLERIRARVFELGAFSSVRVTRGMPDPESGTVPIVVTVREAPLRTVRLGPGLGFDSIRWDAKMQVSWTHRNWLGDLRRLDLQANAGYAWIPNPVNPTRAGTVGKLSAALSQPAVLGRAVDLSTKVELEKNLEQAYGELSATFMVGTPFRLGQHWTFVPSYNLEVHLLRDLVGDVSQSLPELRNCPSEICLLQYLEQRVTWDGRDNPLLTTEGFYASLTVQEGFPLGGQGYRYLRLVPDVRFFEPLGRDTVLATRLRFGALVPFGETGPAPVVALFTAGGAGSMRGYGAERLSPMADQGGTWVPTGGNGVLEGSVEVRQPLGGSLIGALFFDFGNVSDASGNPAEYRSVLSLSLLQPAIGVGVRYRTPVGPFRADLGCRVPTDWRPGVSFSDRFPPVPGDSGHREPIAVLHIALGEAY